MMEKGDALRELAEKRLSEKGISTRPDWSEDIERVVHELEVHQSELELQNDELRNARAIIEESRTRYAELYDFAPIGYFIFDKHGLIKDVNLTGASLLGVERRNLVGSPFNLFILPEAKDAFFAHRNEVCSNGAKHVCEVKLARKDGTTIYASMESIALKDAEGGHTECLSAVSDITERKRAEGNIFRANRLYSVLSKVNEAIVRIREPEELYGRVCRIAVEDGRFKMAWIGLADPESRSVSPVAWYGDTGGYLKDIKIYAEDIPEGRGPTGKAVFEGVYSICSDIEHDPCMLPWREKALLHGFRSSAAFPLHTGPEVMGAFMIYSDKPQFFTDEEIGLLSSLAEDISFAISSLSNEKKKLAAEEALRESEERYRSLFHNSIDGILLTSPGGGILAANAEACRMFGRTEEELYSIRREAILDMTDPKVIAFLDERARTGRARGEITCLHKDGTKLPCEQSSALFKDKEGNIRSSVIVRDISDRKQTDEELRKHRESLEELVEKRTEALKEISEELARSNADLRQFAYVASHDLKEPLRNISGFARLLEKRYKGKLDRKADEYIDFIIHGVARMDVLIRDLLEYSQVERKGKPFGPVNCSVALEEAVHSLRSVIKESGSKLTYDPLPTVVGDASLLSRLFQNLISNAIKFRSDKPLKIHVSAGHKGDEWVFSVKDNGIGIDPKFAERIFVIFQRLHSRGEYEGTGIGLAICKKIVERHGGRMWVESEPGAGSTFYFTIPGKEDRT